MSVFIQFVAFTVVAYLLLVAFMYFAQTSFIFFPTKAQHLDHNLPYVQDYKINRGNVRLGGWLVNQRYVRDRLIVYFGGNAEDVFLNVEEYEDIQAATLLTAYRGYGPSGGRPGEKELFADSLAIVDDMVNRYRPRELFLVGRSLGSGVAAYAASKRAVQGVVLITPYDSIVEVAKAAYPWLPVSTLLKHRFETLKYLPSLRCPVLVIYGGLDRVVSPDRTENLIGHIEGEKKVLFMDKADHSSIDMFTEYWQSLLSFIHSEQEEAAQPE